MALNKKILLLFLLIVLLLGHLITRFTQTEWWPFSNYPMYSVLFKPQYVYFHEIWAVYENGDEEKLKIQNLFYPYNDSSLEEVFLHNRKPQKRQAIIQSLHHWYEQQAYNRSLKKIKKLKLYKFEYEFKTLVDNKNSAEKLLDVRNHPKQKIPLNESINESEAR